MKIYNPTGFSTNLTGSFSGSVKGTLTATGNIIPDVSGAYDIGSTEFPFKDLYITQNSLKFIDDSTGNEIGRISVNSNTGDIKLLNTKNLTEEQKATLTAENVGAEALSPVSASSLWVSQSIFAGHTNTSIGHTTAPFHTLHTQFISASSTNITGDLKVGGTVTAQEFHTEFVSASIIYESGSTQFGNSGDDTHIFSGSISVSNGILGTLSTAAQPNITSLGTLSSLAVSGNLTVDTSTLVVDAANKRVGVGTTSPTQALDVVGGIRASSTILVADNTAVNFGLSSQIYHNSTTGGTQFTGDNGSNTLFVSDFGNVGIGTSVPGHKLEVAGFVVSKDANPQIRMLSTANQTNYLVFGDAEDDDVGYISYEHSTNKMYFRVNTGFRAVINADGNVGIGTTGPNSVLHLHGNTQAWTTSPTIVMSSSNTGNANVRNWRIGPADTNFGNFHIGVSDTQGGIVDSDAEASTFTITYEGRVGINTISPAGRLEVEGTTGVPTMALNSQQIADGSYTLYRVGNSNGWEHGMAGNGDDYSYFFSYGSFGSNTANVEFKKLGQTALGPGTQSVDSKGYLTIRVGNDYAGLDFKTARLSGNLGGLRWYDGNDTMVGQLNTIADGSFNYYNELLGSYAFRITGTNNFVGINSTSPTTRLEIFDTPASSTSGNMSLNTNATTGAMRIAFKEAGTNVAQLAYSHDNNQIEFIAQETTSKIVFMTGGINERAKINYDGSSEFREGMYYYGGSGEYSARMHFWQGRWTGSGNIHLKTNKAWNSSSQMYSLWLLGHEYSAATPVNAHIVWYSYASSGQPINIGTYGTHTVQLYQSSDGYIVIYGIYFKSTKHRTRFGPYYHNSINTK